MVGVNQFQIDEKIELERQKIDPAIEEAAHQRLTNLRAKRDNGKIDQLKGRLVSAANGSENLMPLFIECVEHSMTLGEICNTLRRVWGEYVADGF